MSGGDGLQDMLGVIRDYIGSALSQLADGRRSVRKELDTVYSRSVLGATAVTGSFMKMVEKTLNGEMWLLLGWVGVFVATNLLFVRWAQVAENVDTALKTAADAVEEGED